MFHVNNKIGNSGLKEMAELAAGKENQTLVRLVGLDRTTDF